MKKASLLVLVWLASLSSGQAMASADMAKAKNCMACHAVASKIVGPAFKDVAAKYAGQKGAEDMLAERIVKGGKGVWGAIAMPANTQVSPAEAKTLAKWVLTVK